jgi:hypothetical protein
VRLWVEHVVTHRDHMLVFQQERHLIERGRAWRGVRASRKAFERLAEDALARAGAGSDRPRLALSALLGMVNHTAQWYRPARAGSTRPRSPTATSTCCSAPDRGRPLQRSGNPSVTRRFRYRADRIRALTSQIENIGDPAYVRRWAIRCASDPRDPRGAHRQRRRALEHAPTADIGVVAYHVRKLHQLG